MNASRHGELTLSLGGIGQPVDTRVWVQESFDEFGNPDDTYEELLDRLEGVADTQVCTAAYWSLWVCSRVSNPGRLSQGVWVCPSVTWLTGVSWQWSRQETPEHHCCSPNTELGASTSVSKLM